MKLAAIALLLLSPVLVLATAEPPSSIHLFQTDHPLCGSAKLPCHSADAREVMENGKIYQVFSRKGDAAAELFRVPIGDRRAKYWRYGVSTEFDLNGDGVQDYLWYGGDDTEQSIHLFLSNGQGYKDYDVIKLAEAAWREREHKKAPDFGSMEDWEFVTILWPRKSESPQLLVLLRRQSDDVAKAISLTIPL